MGSLEGDSESSFYCISLQPHPYNHAMIDKNLPVTGEAFILKHE
jgi:hypothetical protein